VATTASAPRLAHAGERVDGRLICNPGALLRDPAPGFDLVTPGTFGVLAVTEASATFEVRRASDGAVVEHAPGAERRLEPSASIGCA
jgi:hypothetical protein